MSQDIIERDKWSVWNFLWLGHVIYNWQPKYTENEMANVIPDSQSGAYTQKNMDEYRCYRNIWYCLNEDPVEWWQFTEPSYFYFGYIKYNHYLLYQSKEALDNGTRGDGTEYTSYAYDIGRWYYGSDTLYYMVLCAKS